MLAQFVKKQARHLARNPHSGSGLMMGGELDALGEAMGLPSTRTPLYGTVTSGPDKGERIQCGYSVHTHPDVQAQAYRVRDSALRLIARHRRFCSYMRETRHGWQVIDTTHYADNSTEVTERSALTGETRNRMTIAPHGDACF